MIKLEAKEIKNNIYYYHLYFLNLAHFKKKKVRRYVSKSQKVANSPVEFLKSTSYFGELQFREYEKFIDLSSFSYSKSSIKRVLVENEKYSFLLNFDPNLKKEFQQSFSSFFIYNSNSIEGSRISLQEVGNIVFGKKSTYSNQNEIQEVYNTLSCFSFFESKFKFNLKSLKQLHSILTKGLFNEQGKNYVQGFRKREIVVGFDARPTLHHSKIKEELQNLFLWYKQHKKTTFPLEFAFEFYYKFELIHPFEDGNGRIGRLLLNYILEHLGFLPMVIFTQNAQSHHRAFVRGEHGNKKYFYDFMIKQYDKNFKEFYSSLEVKV